MQVATNVDDIFNEVVEEIQAHGHIKTDRTGVGTKSRFGILKRFNIRDGRIALKTTKQIFHRSFIHESLWFISGSTDLKYLCDHNIKIWDSWVNSKTAKYRNLTNDEMLKEIFNVTHPNIKNRTLAKHGFDPENENVYVLNFNGVPEDLELTFDLPVDFKDKVVNGDYLEAILFFWYRNVFGKSPTKLLSGDIGSGAYGAMWRNIEDVRRLPFDATDSDRAAEMVSKGFTYEGATDGPSGLSEIWTRNIDQLANAIKLLKTDPTSRRIIVATFDPRMVDFCSLPPCHSWYLFWTRKLSCQERQDILAKQLLEQAVDNPEVIPYELPQAPDTPLTDDEIHALLNSWTNVPEYAISCMIVCRSQDNLVGTPFNVAQYALLTHMVAEVVNMVPEDLVWVGSDVHIYSNHFELLKEEQSREPFYESDPRVVFKRKITDIDDFKFEDIEIVGYDKYHPAIKYPVAV